ncbi:NfeD family protein [Qingshengfaniella alkalisoli]|uniref:NfeD-like partner-binding protein n=1 Tax=Qingshengfaniella alkalisoli TaxID=2599296 RepID=A0A5B8IW91_9RHOB|nr:hypothetical protein [Qingshengfaniella alkalisoli]QDY70422.1 hypothetical protein FPZ52_11945 [Qingshengfaniella alkalisoli]
MIDLVGFINPHTAIFWFVFGAALIVLEILLPSFLALGFGIGAWIVAVVLYFLDPAEGSAPFIFMSWALLSAAVWIVLRKIFRNRAADEDPYDGDINEY